jgi:hypothetical protein
MYVYIYTLVGTVAWLLYLLVASSLATVSTYSLATTVSTYSLRRYSSQATGYSPGHARLLYRGYMYLVVYIYTRYSSLLDTVASQIYIYTTRYIYIHTTRYISLATRHVVYIYTHTYVVVYIYIHM